MYARVCVLLYADKESEFTLDASRNVIDLFGVSCDVSQM